MRETGKLLHIHIASAASFEMEELSEAVLVPGKGIEGDRYFKGNGTYSDRGGPREVTLFEMETLEALALNQPPKQEGPIKLEPGDHRRNLTTRGVPLNHLVGKRFRIGDTVLRGDRINYPCKYLDELLGLPLFMPLYNRSGLNCCIEVGGTIRPGDRISLIES